MLNGRMDVPRLFGRIPSPLEVVDVVVDSVAEVVELPARALSNVAGAGEHAFAGVKKAIDLPKDTPEIPPPPGTVVQGGVNVLASAGSGIFEGVGGVFKAVQDTAEGIKGDIDRLMRG